VNAIIYFIIVWELIFILTNFSQVVKAQRTVIYFKEGTHGGYLGFVVETGRFIKSETEIVDLE